MNFETDPNIIKLDEKIFWYKNFLSEEEVSTITKLLMAQNVRPHFFEEIQFKTTDYMPELFPIWEKVSKFIYPDLVVHPLLHTIYFGEGKEMLPHCDSPGEGMEEELTVPDVWGTCCYLSYGVIVYFGDFTGGEVYYPNQGVEIAVQPGDLVIHGALKEYEHGVAKVKSGHRFAYSNFALKPEKNPGSFYNYGTKEYEEYSKDLTKWALPLFDNKNSVNLVQKPGKPIDQE